MATYTSTRIKLRNDSSTSWEQKNPLLLKGELGFDQTTKYIKIGDGTTRWNSLSSVRLPWTAIDDIAEVDTNTIYKLSASTDGNTVVLLSADGTADTLTYSEVSGSLFSVSTLSGRIYAAEQAITTLNGDSDTEGSVAKSIKDAVEALDVNAVSPADHETIASISEADGKISVTTKAIQLSGIDQVTGLETAINTAKENAISNAESYTNQVSSALSSDYHTKISAVSSDLTANYYEKTETSSATELTTEFATKVAKGDIGISYDSTNKRIELTGTGAASNPYIDATAFVKDGMLLSASLITESESGCTGTGPWLKLVFNTRTGEDEPAHSTIYVDVSKLVDTYTAMTADDFTGISVNGYTIGVDHSVIATTDYADSVSAHAYEQATSYTDSKIADLDVTDTAESNKFVTAVSQTDGKIAVSRAALTYADLPADDLSDHFDWNGAADAALTAANDHTDAISTSMSATVGAEFEKVVYLSATTNKLALSSLTDITTQLNDDYVTEVYCGGTEKTTLSAGKKVVVLNALAFKDTVATADIDDSAVTTDKINNSAVTTAKIADGNVTTDKIDNSAVTTAKIADANVTTGKLADAAVTTAKIDNSAVTTVKVADGAITHDKLATSSVTVENLSGEFIWDCGDASNGDVESAS